MNEEWVYVVLKVERETGKSMIWKVVSTPELAESYYEDNDEKYKYRYEIWRVTGGRTI